MVDKDLHMIAYSSWLAVVSSQCVCVCLLSPGWNKPWHVVTDPRKHKDPRCQRNLKASIYATGSLRQLCVGVWPMVSPTHAILTIYAEHTLDIPRQLDFLLGSFLVCLRVIWGHESSLGKIGLSFCLPWRFVICLLSVLTRICQIMDGASGSPMVA
jgi:hypothetical protein